jgi:predicted pyridoxine 5'-phosphate oxidase superfamily flavin-nucleotide-binding protein
MIIPDEIKKIFEKVDSVVFETAGKEGDQNAVQVFWKKVLNDKTVLLGGDFTKLNEKNLIADNDVRISYWDSEEEKGYQIEGIGRYHTDGSIYKAGRKFMLTKKPDRAPEGVIEVEVTGISIMRPGPCYYRR